VTEAKKHGVLVVHGQGNLQLPGEQLALVANGIADTLENAGGTVVRQFHVEGESSTGLLVVSHPRREGVDEFHFVEGYWARALPDVGADVVAKWMLKRGLLDALTIVRGFRGNIANDNVGDGSRSDYPARFWLRAVFAFELAILSGLVVAVAVVMTILAPVIYAIYSLSGGVGNAKGGAFLAPLMKALHSLDGFLGTTLGDTWRFVEDGMWSSNIRGAVERPLVAFYDDPEIVDITIIAHSAGCGVCYDALAEGRAVGEAAGASPKRLTFASCGSAVNRNYVFALKTQTSPYARRLSVEPIDSRITGVPPGSGPVAAAATDGEKTALRERFYWLDIAARMDLVPGGGLRDEMVGVARIDPCQLKVRRVINEDSLIHDHFGYFNNSDLVTPRLIRALYGGEYPWDGVNGRETPKVTADRIAHRTHTVAWLQALRLAIGGIIVAYAAFFFVSQQFRDWVSRDAGSVVNLDLGALGAFITLTAVLVAPILLLYSLYKWAREWWFEL
jgi:hypothetical protein